MDREKILIHGICFLTILIIGMACNFSVMIHNDGKMPATLQYPYTDEHHISFMNPNVTIQYPYLADTISIGDYLCSPGDIFATIGIVGYVVLMLIYLRLQIVDYIAKKRRPKRRHLRH